MILDITEFKPYMNSSNRFFMQVYDGGTSTTGTMTSFKVETYDDYVSGIPISIYFSGSPINTQHLNNVFIRIYTFIQFQEKCYCMIIRHSTMP